MFETFFLRVISLLELCSIISDFHSLVSNSVKHFVANLSLAFLLTHCRSIWLNQIPPEDRVKTVLKEYIVTHWLHLSEVATQLILKLVV